ncbi:MAG: hypothetical protein KAW84_08525, partial [Thermoplasmata archaeon]|nr:hypothetical protein [Thermoplasmata archaeon]
MKLACPTCRDVFDTVEKKCPNCGDEHQVAVLDEERLLEETEAVAKESEALGLSELVGAIDSVIVQVAPGRMAAAVKELQSMTSLVPSGCYQSEDHLWCVMSPKRPPRFIVKEARRELENPFARFNSGEKTGEDPNTRLETFVFEVNDIEKLFQIQKSRGVSFLTDTILDLGNYRFLQTTPSEFSGNSVGYIQWETDDRDYAGKRDEEAGFDVDGGAKEFVQDVDYLDHTATRVRANDRIEAIKEWLTLLPYYFHMSVYVKSLNSITNVTRMVGQDYAQVFTTGIVPYQGLSAAYEPTERFIVDYGTRIHHLAWNTSRIEDVVDSLHGEGVRFLLDLVGSEEEGLKQTFTEPSAHSMLVTEYIHR